MGAERGWCAAKTEHGGGWGAMETEHSGGQGVRRGEAVDEGARDGDAASRADVVRSRQRRSQRPVKPGFSLA
jgi:hypothetical protein